MVESRYRQVVGYGSSPRTEGMFRDRTDAGQRLGRALEEYAEQDVLVLGIPRGGAEIGYWVAKHLNAEFDLVIARKLPYPHQPEAGFGAVAEDGSTVLLEDASRWVPEETVGRTIARQREEINRRVEALRGGESLPRIAGRTVILVDDGIAMGSTMRAAIKLVRNRGAAKVVAAAPVAGRETQAEIGSLVDDVVILETPRRFRAVAQVYESLPKGRASAGTCQSVWKDGLLLAPSPGRGTVGAHIERV
jgi:putative phosphoribosyl transferase